MTKEELFTLKASPIIGLIRDNTKERWDGISKPLDGFGDFENIICRILAILGLENIDRLNKAVVVMCADNGIVGEGVTQCGQENTYLVAKLLGEQKSTASTMAKFAGARVLAVDIGINCEDKLPGVEQCKVKRGTENFLTKPAMTMEECLLAIEHGMAIAKRLKTEGLHLLATGEMGIGNTTTGTALLCALTGIGVEKVTGRGAGLSDEGLVRKIEVIKKGLEFYQLDATNATTKIDEQVAANYALRALSCVGGLDIAALCGLYIGGAVYGIPVIIDGLISAVAALCADIILPGCREYMIPSHAGREQGTMAALNRLGLSPFINGDMALGEGTGAIMLFPLLDMMLDYFNRATTFDEGNIDKYSRKL